jgi:hypothetical protein
LSTLTLAHAIREDDRRWVVDVTSTDSRLFVLRHPAQQQIQVYDTRTFKQQRALQVKHLSDRTWYMLPGMITPGNGLTSCVTNNCVYVSDTGENTVYKVEVFGSNKVFSWRVGSQPRGLSVNNACNLLVACIKANKIQEYTTSGSLVREVHLQSNDVELCPYHAIQLSSDQFVVSCCNKTNQMYDVVEIDTKGRIIVSYSNQPQSTNHKTFRWPFRLSVDKNKECVLVADCLNNRIVIVDRLLNYCARELNMMSVDGGLYRPSCLYFDLPQNRLCVGELEGQCRVLVLNNLIYNRIE